MAATSNSSLSKAVQLIILSLMASLLAAAPIMNTTESPEPSCGTSFALRKMNAGMEVLRRVHEGKLFSYIRDETDMTELQETETVMLATFSSALNTTCSLRDAKDNLLALDAITGEQTDADIELLRLITNSLINTSCEWTRYILMQLYPSSELLLQCTSDQINHICDEFNSLSVAKRGLQITEDFKPFSNSRSEEVEWVEIYLRPTNSSAPLIQYVKNEPVGL